jgi:integrase
MDAATPLRLIVRKYLAWCGKHRAPRTVEWYQDHLDGFLTHLGNEAFMPMTDLKPYHVVEWVDSHQNWGDTYKRGGIVAVQRAMNWAEELGYIAASPVKKVKKPPARRRDNPMTPEDFLAILAHMREGDPFRDLFQFLWHSACRPQEARHIEPRPVQLLGRGKKLLQQPGPFHAVQVAEAHQATRRGRPPGTTTRRVCGVARYTTRATYFTRSGVYSCIASHGGPLSFLWLRSVDPHTGQVV